jgi:hypothetical protein
MPPAEAGGSRSYALYRTFDRNWKPGYADLLADAQLTDNGLVALGIVLLQVVQQTATPADHHKKTAAGRMVLFVRAEMIRKLADALAQNSDLHFGAPSIIRVGGVLRNYVGLLLSC